MSVFNIVRSSCCAALQIFSAVGCIVLSGKRSNSKQLFTGAFLPPSGGAARIGKNPAVNPFPLEEGNPARAGTAALGEICRKSFIQNTLDHQVVVNHIISLSPPPLPLHLVLLAAFIKGILRLPDEKNILTLIHDLFTGSKPL